MNRVKENIGIYLPAIIKMVGDNLDWRRIDKLFSDELVKRSKNANGDIIRIEATIYDIIIEAKKKNLQAIRFLSYFQRLLEELSVNLSFEEQKLIKKNIRDFLTSFDLKHLDFIGELS